MFSQNRAKIARVRKVGGGAYVGRHKMLVDLKTGMGFFSSLKGFFQKAFRAVAPTVKKAAQSFIDSGKAQELVKGLAKKGTEKLNDAITKKFGPSADRDKLISGLTSKGTDLLVSKGSQLASKLLEKGLNTKAKNREDLEEKADVEDATQGKGVSRIKKLMKMKGSGIQMV